MTAPPPPGPRGAILGRLNARSFDAGIFGFLRSLAESFGDVVGFDLGGTPCILVNGAENVRTLFLRHEGDLRKPAFVSDSNRGHWGDGLTTLEGADWQARRPLLRPSFRPQAIGPRLDIARECTGEMLDGWEAGAVVDLPRELRILTARIAARSVLDADIEGYGRAEDRSGLLPFAEAFGEDFASGSDAGLTMRRPRAPRDMRAAVAIIDDRLRGGAERDDMLSYLIRARPPCGASLDREAIIGEALQLLYAGHLTVPASLVAFWRILADEPAALAAISAEAPRLCAGGEFGQAELARSYGMAALKEAMRLEPPAPILYREIARRFELGGYGFEAGHAVWASPRLMHRDPRHFEAPDSFLPERFLPGRLTSAARAAYLPFGAGPRTCIAAQQSLLQMTLIALLVSRRFALSPSTEEAGAFVAAARP